MTEPTPPAPRAIAAGLPRGFTSRFAPAPTGYLHLGHIVNAVWVWGLARARGGHVLLRIEDHDRGRCRPEYERALLEDLDWLGFAPDGASVGDFRAGAHEQRQSDKLARYAALVAELEQAGVAYACRCSRAEIERAVGATTDVSVDPEGSELRYPGTCRDAAVDPLSTPARRVRVEPGVELARDLRLGELRQDPAMQCGDLLLRDRNGHFTYQFAVTVDDFDQNVDVVIRGEDLIASTGRQLRLARLLGRGDMPRFVHHPLVRDASGRKLSKAAGDTAVRELRAAGATPEEVIGRAAAIGGTAHSGAPLAASSVGSLFG